MEMDNSGAGLLTREFNQADQITFFIGRMENPANQSAYILMDMRHKWQIIQRLIAELKKMGKQTKIYLY